jgi:hypothetical protein
LSINAIVDGFPQRKSRHLFLLCATKQVPFDSDLIGAYGCGMFYAYLLIIGFGCVYDKENVFRRYRHFTVRGRLKALKISNDTFQGCQVWHYAPLSLTRCLHLCPHQPQHTPHLRQAAVAAALRQSQLLEGQFGNCEDQPPDPVPLCLRSLSLQNPL